MTQYGDYVVHDGSDLARSEARAILQEKYKEPLEKAQRVEWIEQGEYRTSEGIIPGATAVKWWTA